MPQILKPEIKDKILSSALDCFLEKGYRNASMQEIAGRAGIAAGNIYNYFHNKEELFSTLITPTLAQVKAIFGVRASDLPMLSLSEGLGIAGKKMDAFIDVYRKNRRVFVLLFDKSDSTKFETTKGEVFGSLSAAILHAKDTLTNRPATPRQETLIRAFAAAYVSGIISILTTAQDEGVKLEALQQFLPFMRAKLIDSLR